MPHLTPDSLAVVALVLGLCFPLAAIPVVGHWTRHQTSSTGEHGGGLALTGLILGFSRSVWRCSRWLSSYSGHGG
jgi:hypothetical protein